MRISRPIGRKNFPGQQKLPAKRDEGAIFAPSRRPLSRRSEA
jgi:hypothetical protein